MEFQLTGGAVIEAAADSLLPGNVSRCGPCCYSFLGMCNGKWIMIFIIWFPPRPGKGMR